MEIEPDCPAAEAVEGGGGGDRGRESRVGDPEGVGVGG